MSYVPATLQFCPSSTVTATEMNRWVWPCANKTLFRQTGGRPCLLSPALQRIFSEYSHTGSAFPKG